MPTVTRRELINVDQDTQLLVHDDILELSQFWIVELTAFPAFH